jgi:hypothetical protein
MKVASHQEKMTGVICNDAIKCIGLTPKPDIRWGVKSFLKTLHNDDIRLGSFLADIHRRFVFG